MVWIIIIAGLVAVAVFYCTSVMNELSRFYKRIPRTYVPFSVIAKRAGIFINDEMTIETFTRIHNLEERLLKLRTMGLIKTREIRVGMRHPETIELMDSRYGTNGKKKMTGLLLLKEHNRNCLDFCGWYFVTDLSGQDKEPYWDLTRIVFRRAPENARDKKRLARFVSYALRFV